jgi:hypothetical protein
MNAGPWPIFCQISIGGATAVPVATSQFAEQGSHDKTKPIILAGG